ncbi:hypothetical protein EJ110_NYTH20552 [Nymphaea thermarum]|nr:hypothetical protein EJ110_NYTH20552 [Nymphaea thermarum]
MYWDVYLDNNAVNAALHRPRATFSVKKDQPTWWWWAKPQRKNGEKVPTSLYIKSDDRGRSCRQTREGALCYLFTALVMESVLLSLIIIFIGTAIFRLSCKFRRTRGNQENHSEVEVSSSLIIAIIAEGIRLCQLIAKMEMVECRRLIIPVFFHVEPRDARHQTGPFSSAFKSYSKKGKVEREEVSKWGDALGEAGQITGYNLTDTEG